MFRTVEYQARIYSCNLRSLLKLDMLLYLVCFEIVCLTISIACENLLSVKISNLLFFNYKKTSFKG